MNCTLLSCGGRTVLEVVVRCLPVSQQPSTFAQGMAHSLQMHLQTKRLLLYGFVIANCICCGSLTAWTKELVLHQALM
jgi:hypothetical protein